MKHRILFQLLVALTVASSTAYAAEPAPPAPTVRAPVTEPAHVVPHATATPSAKPAPLPAASARLTRGTSASELAARTMRPLGEKPPVAPHETPHEITLHNAPPPVVSLAKPQAPKTPQQQLEHESAFLKGLSANTKALQSEPRSLVVSGAGPAGAYSALEAYLNHSNVTVTVIDKRGEHNLPIVWNQRQGTREEHARIDPILAKAVAGVSGEIKSVEFLTLDANGNEVGAPIIRQPKQAPVDVNGKTVGADALANAPSVFQTKAANEMKAVWARLDQLAKKEADKAASTPGYKPRLQLLKDHEIDETPVEGDKRRVVVKKTADMWVNAATGEQRAIVKGAPTPAGFSKRLVKTGEAIDLGVPDLFLVAEGAGSSTRNMIGGFEWQEVGPNTRYIAGYVKGITLSSRPDPDTGLGGGKAGVVRRSLRTENIEGADGTKTAVALRSIAISPENLKDIWALAEVDPRLDFDKPESIKAFFHKDMPKEEAVKSYYAQHISKLTGRGEDEIKNAMFDYGPTPFVLQSHITGPAPDNAQNVQVIGDAKANSHFLTSFGAVGGSTNTPIALRQYYADLDNGLHPDIARATLAKRVDINAVAWVRNGLKEFTGVGPVNFGKAVADLVKAQLGDKTFTASTYEVKATDTADPTENGNR